jgi:hypothetical protein
MAIIGQLADFSLAELFQFLEQGQKTGLLTINSFFGLHSTNQKTHFLWFSQGRIVAASNRLDGQGLFKLMVQRALIEEENTQELFSSCAINTPVGLCFKAQKILDSNQLKLLFYAQVMQEVCALFKLPDASFQFDPKSPLIMSEMTGLSMPAMEVTLTALRGLKDWSMFANKLPEVTSGLISKINGKPHFHLNHLEWQLWEFTNGKVSLKEISKSLNLSIYQIQQIAFRLIVVGLAEEIPLIDLSGFVDEEAKGDSTAQKLPTLSEAILEPSMSSSKTKASSGDSNKVSQSFLNNLLGFLKNKA